MNWFGTQTALIEAAFGAASFSINWLVQSTILIAAGLAVGALIKRRGSAAQSVVYRATLVAVLICPMMTWALSYAGAPGWSIQLPEHWTRSTALDVADVAGRATTSGEQPTPSKP